MMGAKIRWKDAAREALRTAWLDETLTEDQVAQQVGHGVAACRNEARRMGLPDRSAFRNQSTIMKARRGSSEPRAQPVRPGQRTLPLLPSEEAALGQ